MNILSFLFRCHSCEAPIHAFKSFPLCSICHSNLIDDSALSHQVCHQCLAFCAHPGQHYHSLLMGQVPPQEVSSLFPNFNCLAVSAIIDKFFFGTVLTERSLRTIRSWKKNRSSFLTQKIFSETVNMKVINQLRSLKIDFIIPIPHQVSRLRQLDGSPTLALSKVLSKFLGARIENQILYKNKNNPSHGKLDFKMRLQHESLFDLKIASAIGQLINKKVLIVDDIATTTSTLHGAGRLLRLCGPKELYGFSWGVRLGSLS